MIVVVIMTSCVDYCWSKPFVVEWLENLNEKDEVVNSCDTDQDCTNPKENCGTFIHEANDYTNSETFANPTFTAKKCIH